MRKNLINGCIAASLFAALLCFPSCKSASYSITSVEGGRMVVDKRLDARPHTSAEDVLLMYKNKVDSIMSPVIGYSVKDMSATRPESTLSNLVADVLRKSALKYVGAEADVAVINMGGLRASLPKGELTIGNIFEITPFENTLCILTMSGKDMRYLFENLASVYGEGLSGAEIEVSKDRKLLSAKIAGKEIEDDKMYRVATVDYLAEGNDNMLAFKNAKEKIQPDGATLRSIFIDYVKSMTAQGKKLDSKIEGRVVINKDK